MDLIHRVKINQIEMMELRGKVIPSVERPIKSMSTGKFEEYYQNRLSEPGHPLNMVYYTSDAIGTLSDPLPIFYVQSPDGTSIKGVELREKFFELLTAGKYGNAILIHLGKITSLKSIIKEYPAYIITVFDMNELIVNPTKHVFSDKIVKKLNNNEIRTLTKRIKPENLQQLCYDDPVVKFWGFVPGDIALLDDLIGDDRLMVKGYQIHKLVGTNSIHSTDRNI